MGARRAQGGRWWHFVAIVGLVALAYAGSLGGAFVSDDTVTVVRNEVIRGLDGAHLVRIATTFDDANYIPVKVLSVAIDYHFWELDPVGHHLTNVLIHIGCALLVYLVLRRLQASGGAALAVALLWALHPLQVESVAWISERKNVLSGLFFFATFYVYLGFRARGGVARYLVLVLLYVLALLSKMNTVVLPALMLAFELAWHYRIPRGIVRATVPLFVLGAVVVAYNLYGNPMHGTEWHGGSPIVTWLSSAVVVFRYLAAVVVPTGLAPRYDVLLRGGLLDPPVLASVIALTLLVLTTLWLIVRRRREAFWLAWFFICLGPMLNVIPFRGMMHDRFMYLPLLGPIALVVTWIDARVRTARRRRLAAIVTSLVVVLVGALTVRQVEIWDSAFSLWRAEATVAAFVAHEPGRPIPDHAAKRAFLAEAVASRPSSAIAHNNHAAMFYAEGRVRKALPGFERAATLAPAHPNILVNLGRAYAALDRDSEAEVLLARAADLDRYRVHTHLYLARLRLARRDAEGAAAALGDAEALLSEETAARAFARERAALEELSGGR